MTKRNWIVISGGIVDTVKGGGLEFFGPFTEPEAEAYKQHQDQHKLQINFALELIPIRSARPSEPSVDERT